MKREVVTCVFAFCKLRCLFVSLLVVSHPKKLWASRGVSVRATSVKLLLVSLPFANDVVSLFVCFVAFWFSLWPSVLVSWLLVLLVAGSLGRPR